MDTSQIDSAPSLIRVLRDAAAHPFRSETTGELYYQRSAVTGAISGRQTPLQRSKLGEAII